ncbi:MAG: hypothetical protein ACRCT8_06160 [Lacipirellulaceae bacterium]
MNLSSKLVGAVCLVTVASAVLLGSSLGPRSSAPRGFDQSDSTTVAARWYQRARQGQLHYRATPAGRNLQHTLKPISSRRV